MTSLATSVEEIPQGEFEVATVSSDALRAGIRVSGALGPRTVPLLLSVLATHVRAGRRYLRVDLSAATLGDPGVLGALCEAHTRMTELGGMLVFDNVPAEQSALLHDGQLYVSTAL